MMKRFAPLFLTGLTLFSGLADARGRSGGGFGAGRSSRSYSSGLRGSIFSFPRSSAAPRSTQPSYSQPGYSQPSYAQPPYLPPRNTAAASPYTGGRVTGTARTPSAAQRAASYPSTSSVRFSPVNAAAAAKVTPTQLSSWQKVKLPAGVPSSAVTYSAAPSNQYRYQLQPGRYYPYPQSYYRQHHIGYDILKYALIFTAVSSVANAITPHVVVNQGDLNSINTPVVMQQRSGPNLWTYVGAGFLAAAAAWFVTGRQKRR